MKVICYAISNKLVGAKLFKFQIACTTKILPVFSGTDFDTPDKLRSSNVIIIATSDETETLGTDDSGKPYE